MMRVNIFLLIAMVISLIVAGCRAALPGAEMDAGAPAGAVDETPAAQEKEPPAEEKQPSAVETQPPAQEKEPPPAEERQPPGDDRSPAAPTVPAGAQNLVDLAMEDLARALQGEAGAIALLSVEARDFSDASLGVPEPDKMYAQVITPGYVIRLGLGDKVYTYHGSGERVVRVPEE
jgi:hypothetical protein